MLKLFFSSLSLVKKLKNKNPILCAMRPTRRGRPTGRNDGGGGGNEEDFEDEQKLSVFDREKVLEFLLRGPHGAGRGRDDDDRDEDGFDGGAHGGGGGGRDDVDDDDDSEKENDGEEKTKTTTSRGGRSVLIKERERKKAERFYQVMLKEAQRLVCEAKFLPQAQSLEGGGLAEGKKRSCKGARVELDLHRCEEIPLWVRNRAPERFCLLTTRIAVEETSGDGSTTKLIVELQDGHRVEAVIIRHLKGRRAEGKKGMGATLCISSQVGCKMGCTFCATGTMGELGNLTTGEIVEQVAHARRIEPRVRNIVFMGMGEPLNNYDAVVDAIRCVSQNENQMGFNIPCPKICVSTVGVIPNIYRFSEDCPTVSMALSLHAPTQEIRKKIVPTATAYPLDELMRCLDDYLAKSEKNSMLVEYCVLKGINDTKECARLLGELLGGKKVVLNFIPYNPTDVIAGHERPDMEDIQAMNTILREDYGMTTTVRQEMGSDIAGACGQLAISVKGKKLSSMEKEKTLDEDEDGEESIPGIRDIEEMLGQDLVSVAKSNKTKIKKTSKTTTSKNKTSTSSETSSIKQYFSDWTTAEIAMLGVATACSIALLSARFSSNRK
jgi:adenine C2-methylase RlmN of 23S rRNA A2503 and tRNA A37